MRALISLVVLALASASVGCGKALSFESQDVILRHDVEGDALDVMLIYHGVFAHLPKSRSDDERKKQLDDGIAAFERIAAGAREGAIGEEHLCFSIDKQAANEAAKSNDVKAGQRVAIYRLITLEDHAVFVDEKKRLCGFQRFRIHPWSEFEARVNALISSEVIESTEPNEDPEGVAMRVAKAKAGSPWFVFKNRQLLLDLPMTHTEYAWGTRLFLGPQSRVIGGAGSLLTELLASAQSLTLDAHGLSAVVGDGKAPIHWEIENLSGWPTENDPGGYDHRLCEALRAKGVELRQDIQVSELIAAMK